MVWSLTTEVNDIQAIDQAYTSNQNQQQHQDTFGDVTLTSHHPGDGGRQSYSKFEATSATSSRRVPEAPSSRQTLVPRNASYLPQTTHQSGQATRNQISSRHSNVTSEFQSFSTPRPTRSSSGMPAPVPQAQRIFTSTPSLNTRPHTAQHHISSSGMGGKTLPPITNSTQARFRPVTSAQPASSATSNGGMASSAPRRFAMSAATGIPGQESSRNRSHRTGPTG